MIRFESKAASSVTMFDKDAKALILMMKHSGTVPGAILTDDIEKALRNLQDSLKEQASLEADSANDSQDTHEHEQDKEVDFGTRAYPLIQLLETAMQKHHDVMWDYDNAVL